MTIPLHVLPLALALAGAAGLRAFLPLFYLSVALHFNYFNPHQLNPHLSDYIDLVHSSGPMLTLGLLAAVELMIESIPLLSTAMEIPFLLLRMVMAMVTAFAVLPIKDFSGGVWCAGVVGFIGAIAILNLQVRNTVDEVDRLPSYLHFAASLLMAAICLAVVSISLQLPYVGLVILFPGTWLATLLTHTWKRKIEYKVQIKRMGPAPEMPEEFLKQQKGMQPP